MPHFLLSKYRHMIMSPVMSVISGFWLIKLDTRPEVVERTEKMLMVMRARLELVFILDEFVQGKEVDIEKVKTLAVDAKSGTDKDDLVVDELMAELGVK